MIAAGTARFRGRNIVRASLLEASDGRIPAEWWGVFRCLQRALERASAALDDAEFARLFQITVTEREILDGILSVPANRRASNCFVMSRVISDYDLNDPQAAFYTDVVASPAGRALDAGELERRRSLMATVASHIGVGGNVREFSVRWAEADQTMRAATIPRGFPIETHHEYLREFADHYCAVMMDSILSTAIANKREEDALFDEVAQHASRCLTLSRVFHGMQGLTDAVLGTLTRTLSSSQGHLVIVHGPSGIGKSSFMARASAALQLPSQVVVLRRFLGTSLASSNIRLLLESLVEQLVSAWDERVPPIPEAFEDLCDLFASTLGRAHALGRPVIVFLDSLDQLHHDNAAWRLDWLPERLPDSVVLIVSTLTESDASVNILANLKGRYAGASQDGHVSVFQVPQLSAGEASAVLDSWLSDDGRRLASRQRDLIDAAFTASPTPMTLRLAYALSTQWRSTDVDVEVAHSVRGLIRQIFVRAEKAHGKVLVSRALGYLTASRFGLSMDELEDILSVDDDVLDDVFQYWAPQRRRIPTMLVLRLLRDFEPFLVRTEADGAEVIRWYHRQFAEAAEDIYLAPVRRTLHATLAGYFGGAWGAGKTFRPGRAYGKVPGYTVGEAVLANRFISAQPLVLVDASASSFSARAVRYNMRRLTELPYQLVSAGLWGTYRDDVLCPSFLEGICRTGRGHAFLRDLLRVKVPPGERAVRRADGSAADMLEDIPRYAFHGSPLHKDAVRAPHDLACAIDIGCPVDHPSLVLSTAQHSPGNLLYAAEVSASGTLAATLSEDGVLRTWDLTTGESVGTRRLRHPAPTGFRPRAVYWSSERCALAFVRPAGGDKDVLCAIDGEGVVYACDATSLSVLSEIALPAASERLPRLHKVHSGDGTTMDPGSYPDCGLKADAGARALVAFNASGYVVLEVLGDGALAVQAAYRETDASLGPLATAALSCAADLVALGFDRGNAEVHRASDGAAVRSFVHRSVNKGGEDVSEKHCLNGLCFSGCGRFLAAVNGYPGSFTWAAPNLQVYDTSTWASLHQVWLDDVDNGHAPTDIAFLSSGGEEAADDVEVHWGSRFFRLGDARDERVRKNCKFKGTFVGWAGGAGGGGGSKDVFVSRTQHELLLFRRQALMDPKPRVTFPNLAHVMLTPDGGHLLLGEQPNIIEQLKSMPGHTWLPEGLVPRTRWTGGSGVGVRVIDTATLAMTACLEDGGYATMAHYFTQDGRFFVDSNCGESSPQNRKEGDMLYRFGGTRFTAYARGAWRHVVREPRATLFNAHAPRARYPEYEGLEHDEVFYRGTRAITGFAESPSGRVLVGSPLGADSPGGLATPGNPQSRTVYVWDMAARDGVPVLCTHFVLDFTPDDVAMVDDRLLLVCGDGKYQVWDLVDARRVTELAIPGPLGGGREAMCVLPIGGYFVCGSTVSGTIHVLSVDVREQQQQQEQEEHASVRVVGAALQHSKQYPLAHLCCVGDGGLRFASVHTDATLLLWSLDDLLFADDGLIVAQPDPRPLRALLLPSANPGGLIPRTGPGLCRPSVAIAPGGDAVYVRGEAGILRARLSPALA